MTEAAGHRQELREALRGLALPIAPAGEDAALDAAVAALDRHEVAMEDQAQLVRLEVDKCREQQRLSGILAIVAKEAIRAGNPDLSPRLAQGYTKIHQRLIAKFRLSYDEATWLLGHARLAARLAQGEAMSSAQVARVLTARDRQASFGWRPIRAMLDQLGAGAKISQPAVEQLHELDQQSEQVLLADADARVSALVVAQAGSELGFPGNLEGLLMDLAITSGPTFWPYLQILHYQCVIAEFYDHPLTMLYEFAPRGNAAKWVFNRYRSVGVPTGNPVLNNAKAVDRLDRQWASSRLQRNSDPRAARALVEVLEGMEDMGFLARRELATWLRRWLLRTMRLHVPIRHRLPKEPSAAQIKAVLGMVAAGETRTAGVIEQRVVDALTSALHHGQGWRPRGLSDSVNASNVSRKKLGDCEFQDAAARRVVAYEAHGGRLSDVYLEGHLRTLARVVPLRAQEWEGIADPSDWDLEVVFVAHDITAASPTSLELDGFHIAIRLMDYQQLIEGAPGPSELIQPFRDCVHSQLNANRTPDIIRRRYQQILDAKSDT